MIRYNPKLIKRLGEKLNKPEKYIREQISKRARKDNISSEAALAKWAQLYRIPISSYVRQLPPNIQSQIYSPLPITNNNGSPKSQIFRIVQIGRGKDRWYNLWWVQVFVLGILASFISQIAGTFFTNALGLTKP